MRVEGQVCGLVKIPGHSKFRAWVQRKGEGKKSPHFQNHGTSALFESGML